MSDGSLLFDTKLDTSGLRSGLGTVGSIGKGALSVLGTAAAGIAAGATAATTAIGGLATASIQAYADYEQLVGGVDTLFGEASQKVQEYAAQAYETAGLSANEYMETVTSFSASLLQSLDGDTEAAAEYANQAIVDMSDNANKMGTSMEAIQNAYNGFAKQNYTMLDNLKLGYGGTKEEMQRLLDDASEIAGIEFSIDSYADVTQAIHVMQESMGIAGTTAKEASTTISGSLGMLKSAWSNLLVGFSDENADIDQLISNVTDSLVTFLDNIVPRIQQALPSLLSNLDNLIGSVVEALGPTLVQAFTELLPMVMESAIGLITSLIEGIQENLDMIVEVASEIITMLIDGLSEALPTLLEAGLSLVVQLAMAILENLPRLIEVAAQMILTLATGIGESLPELIPQIVDIVLQICTTLIENLDLLIEAAIQLFLGLVTGLIQALPQIIAALPTLITSIIDALINSIPLLVDCGVQLFLALIENLPTIIVELVKAAPQIVNALVKGFTQLATQFKTVGKDLMTKLKDGITGMLSNLVSEAKNIGKNIIDGIWNGIEAGWDWLKEKVGGLASSLFDSAKSALGIASPSKKFRYLGEMCVAGFDDGIEDLMDGQSLGASINASLATVSANTGAGLAGGAGSAQTFNFYDTQTSPDAIRRKVQNTMTFGLAGGI